MKKLGFILMTLVLLVFNSCKKDTVDVTDLLKTVPSSAGGVMVFNLENMLEKAGCKIKDHEIIPGPELEALINQGSATSQQDIKVLFDGSTGIETKGAVIFYDSNRVFLTVLLHDENKFCQFVEKQSGASFSDEGNGLKVLGNTAVKGGQAWILLSRGRRIDPDGINSYAKLATSQSFLVTPMGEELLVSEDDIRGWALLDTFTDEFMNRQNRSMVTLGLGFLFDKAESLKFSIEFEKGEYEIEAIPLDSKFKPAKYKLPSEKVNVDLLKSLGTTCDGLMAFTVTPKLVDKIDELSRAFGGALFGDLKETLKNINGTVGVITSGAIDINMNSCALIETKGDLSQSLKSYLSEYVGNLSVEGNVVRVQKGEVSGNLDVATCAEELKGACMGMVIDQSEIQSLGGISTENFSSIIFKMEPKSGSVEFKIDGKTRNPDENAILSVIKAL